MDELICAAITQSTHHDWGQLPSFKHLKPMLRPAGRAEQRDSQQRDWSTTPRFLCFQMFGLPLKRRKIQLLAVTLVVQTLWSTFYSCCGCDWFITFSLIFISEYVNYQLLREETECNMKISCHVGVNPSSALTLQLPSARVCVLIHMFAAVFSSSESNPHVRQKKRNLKNVIVQDISNKSAVYLLH